VTSTILVLLATVGRGPTWWPGMSVPAFVLSSIVYVSYRIVVGRMRGKNWTDILSDGWKPATGSIWLDGALFAGILIAMFAATMGAMWFL
jgi:hypothetical protein